MGKLRDAYDRAKIRAVTKVPGVMANYDGFMHAFHDIPVEGCDRSRHSGRDYELGFQRGLSHPDKPARDEAERRWREWRPSETDATGDNQQQQEGQDR